MGKIIRNGIEFSGTSDSANNINYDNSVSGLEARTAQEAIDTLSVSLGGLKFGTDGDGNYGYYGDDDVLVPFKGSLELISTKQDVKTHPTGAVLTATVSYTHTCVKSGSAIVILHGSNESGNYGSITESVKINGVEQNKNLQIKGCTADFTDIFLLDCKAGDVIDLSVTTTRHNSCKMYASYALYA